METFVNEAKRLLTDVERFLVKIAKKLPTALDRERDVFVQKIKELLQSAEAAERRRASVAMIGRGGTLKAKPQSPTSGRRPSGTTAQVEDEDLYVDADPESVNPADDVYVPPKESIVEDEQYLAVDDASPPPDNYLIMHKLPPPSQQEQERRRASLVSEGGGSVGGGDDVKKKKGAKKAAASLKEIVGDAQQEGVVKRKKDKLLGGKKWIEQHVVLRDDSMYVADKGSDEVREVYVLTSCAIDVGKPEKQQQHVFQIKSKTTRTSLTFAASNVAELQDWVRALKRATVQSTQSEPTEQADDVDDEEVYEVPEEQPVTKLRARDSTASSSSVSKQPAVPADRRSARRSTVAVDTTTTHGGVFYPKDKRVRFDAIYVAVYDCVSESTDEVELERGDLIWIDYREHKDWWVGTKQSSDGAFKGKRGFVPSAYLALAYEKCN